ncbi:NAD(P)/FAD-dependent oxidoreductase [Sutcliffiella deserti]|uniref:NAD(P)/FAD-dependent oxidoreductase n=1 Tax=Sutcliffiella deserti TaxID=2875501 RepID=UPI001CBBFFB0|nr:FAD-dependent oxidoreductase [Sutcliffiella deserti]
MKKIIVVGAGILGASTAFHLAKSGADVTLIDRFDTGQATDAAAGIICPWISQRRNKAWYQLVKRGASYYPSLIDQLKADGETETGYSKVGALSLHTDAEKLLKIAERAQKRKDEAPEIGEISILSPEETKKRFPPLSEEFGSVYISGAARVNGRALRVALINAAKKHGAIFLEGDAELIHKDTKVTGVKLKDQILYADKVAVTGGAWARKLLEPLGVRFSVTPQKAQIVHLELPHTDTSNWPVVMPPNNQYILCLEKGRVIVGATHEDESGFDYRVTAGGISDILAKAMEVAPGLSVSTILETRVGFRPFTPGFLPVIGPIPEFEGLLLANGLGASGLTSGPYLGMMLAQLALDETCDLNLEEYNISGAIEE